MSLKNNWKPTDTLRNTDVNDIANEVNKNTEHKETKINENDYTHGLKYNKEQNSLIIKTDSGDVSIGGSNDSSDIQFTPDDSGLISNNIQDAIREVNNNINEHEKLDILNENGVHGIKYDELTQTLKYKKEDSWENIPTGQQAEEDLKLHEEKKVNSVEGVHGFRYNSTNETLEIESEEGQWTEVGGGLAGALLSPVTNIKVKAGNTKLTVSWTDSTEGTWAGTKLVYKVGSYPENPKDGTLAVDNKVKDQYKTTGFDINALNNGTKYYFAFFPYDTKNKYSLNIDNRAIGTPQAFRTMTVKIEQNNSNPETRCTYHDNAVGMTPGSDDWDEFFGHFPCLLKNGQISERLKRDNRTKKEDGSPADITSGNGGDAVMVFPRRQLKIWTVGNNELWISMTDDLSLEADFKNYAHTREDGVKDFFCLGIYKGYQDSNNQLRSLSGKKATDYQTPDDSRNDARRNGTGYDQMGFYQLTYLQAMYILKYKNTDAQTTIGIGLDVTNIINTGGTELKPMDWGGQSTSEHIALFGLEDLYGGDMTWMDGIYTNASQQILTTTVNKFNLRGTGYNIQGVAPPNEFAKIDYIKLVHGTNELGFLPKEYEGSSTTYFCDAGNNVGPAGQMFGGWMDNFKSKGTGMFDTCSDYAYIGEKNARLMYL